MGHLAICNNETLQDILDTGYISTRGNLNYLPIKTISDLFSDVLAVRKGDYIFPWIIQGANNVQIGFKFVFKVSGPPIYVKDEEYPIKIPLQPDVIYFENSLIENEALDLFRQTLLWNAIGKKSLGRGRSLTHQTKEEDNLLIDLMMKKNKGEFHKIKIKTKYFKGSYPISIDLNQNDWSNEFLDQLGKIPEIYNRISKLDVGLIPWVKNVSFSYEKTFEAWLMENADKKECRQLWDLLFDGDYEIKWLGNYLPFGVSGSNIDAVVYFKSGKNLKLFVLELKNTTLNLSKYRIVCGQVLEYTEFIKRAFLSFNDGVNFEVIPVIISRNSGSFNKSEMINKKGYEIIWLGYEIVKGKITFTNHLCK